MEPIKFFKYSFFQLKIFDDLAVKSIILENISDVADENQVLECISRKTEGTAAENFAESIQNDLLACISYTGFEYNLLFDSDPIKIMEYLQIFGDHLNIIAKLLLNCNKIELAFKNYFKSNPKFIETMLDFLKNLSNIATFSNISLRTDWCTIKTDLTHKLFSFTLNMYETSFFVDVMKQTQADDERTKALYDRCGTSKLIRMLISKPVRNKMFRIQFEIIFYNQQF